MPWLPLYATREDLGWLLSQLSDEPEMAFLVSAGDKRWIAVKRAEFQSDCRFCLWHIPSGPLPLLREKGKCDSVITDPWSGWTEEKTGADPSSPYFGAGHVGIIWLNARSGEKKRNAIGLSSFEWIGNHYRIIGQPAPVVTEKFWKKLGRLIKKQAIRIPRSGPWDGPNPEIWAMPEALKKIVMGVERDANP
jgi:hypothetical protein